MNTEVCGLNKIRIHTDDVTPKKNEVNVTLQFGTTTMSSKVVDNVAEFMLPSIPVPGRSTYTASYGDATKEIPVGFGDITDVWLSPKHANVKKKELDAETAARTEECNALADEISEINGKIAGYPTFAYSNGILSITI